MDSEAVREQWADRSGEYSPSYYAHYGPDDTSAAIGTILDRFVDRDAAVLELGCSSGRHLAALHERGYEDLTGIDVNPDAFDVMGEAYPDLAEAGTFAQTTIEDAVVDFDDDSFDVVYSVETLQHIHPDAEWVFEDLARITADLLITAESESPAPDSSAEDSDETPDPEVNYVDDDCPLYYRDWHHIFTDLGLTQIDVREGQRDTVRTFRVPES